LNKMSELALKRIQRELASILDDPPPGCFLLQMGDDLFQWKVEVQGPPDSPFEDGTFTLHVIFPKTYPFQPPKVKFETRIFHPNINQSGDICLDTLAAQWVPSMSMAQVLLSITLLLSSPNPNDPINLEAARVFRHDPEDYNRRVRRMTGQQSGRGRQGRSEVGGRSEEEVFGPHAANEVAGEVAEQEEEGEPGVDEVDAGAGGGEEADAEVNIADEEEAAAQEENAEEGV